MGCGKTHVADQYLKQLGDQTSTLVITFRISLAQYLAERLSLNSYLEDGIWSSTEEA
ncbi:uncharacterized protein BYT42DRAFT_479471, partial [Radiomyces spectabilis]|uniref:uncharacterized protein n=1 Tax=Radiomyces spectabilis TaxID=64574 RepID=UPI00221E6C48